MHEFARALGVRGKRERKREKYIRAHSLAHSRAQERESASALEIEREKGGRPISLATSAAIQTGTLHMIPVYMVVM